MNKYTNKSQPNCSDWTPSHLLFSFAEPRLKSTQQPHYHSLNPQQIRATAMLLLNCLQRHSPQFLVALTKIQSQNLTVPDLYYYLQRQYNHYSQITKFYIIAALIDYGVVSSLNPEINGRGREMPLVDLVVQELGKRHHRESLWWQKISYIPPYILFESLEVFKKGYLTKSEIQKFVKESIGEDRVRQKSCKNGKKHRKEDVKKQGDQLVEAKLKRNLGQGLNRFLRQQNLLQLLLRLNQKDFKRINMMGDGSMFQSVIYTRINECLEKEKEVRGQNQHNIQYLGLQEGRKTKQIWQCAKEDYDIKVLADKIIHEEGVFLTPFNSTQRIRTPSFAFSDAKTVKPPSVWFNRPFQNIDLNAQQTIGTIVHNSQNCLPSLQLKQQVDFTLKKKTNKDIGQEINEFGKGSFLEKQIKSDENQVHGQIKIQQLIDPINEKIFISNTEKVLDEEIQQKDKSNSEKDIVRNILNKTTKIKNNDLSIQIKSEERKVSRQDRESVLGTGIALEELRLSKAREGLSRARLASAIGIQVQQQLKLIWRERVANRYKLADYL